VKVDWRRTICGHDSCMNENLINAVMCLAFGARASESVACISGVVQTGCGMSKWSTNRCGMSGCGTSVNAVMCLAFGARAVACISGCGTNGVWHEEVQHE
jgi:hypothetical protein